MLTDFNHLCNQRPIVEAIDADYHPNLAEFTRRLNHHINGYGELGYEEAEKFNLKINKPYTQAEAAELLKQIERTRKLCKMDIYLSEIDEIPWGIAHELAIATNSGANTISEARNTTIRYGIMHGDELIGFVSGDYWRNIISIGGLYIREDYRRRGLSTKLLRIMMNKAEREGLEGISMSNASWQGQDAMKGLHRAYEKEGRSDIGFHAFSEDFRNFADLFFKK